jgi:hypothetical protein
MALMRMLALRAAWFLALVGLAGCGSSGGGSPAAPAEPFLSRALAFDGVNDVAQGHAPANFTFTGGVSFEAWIRPHVAPGSNVYIGATGTTAAMFLSGLGNGSVGFTVSVPGTDTVFSTAGAVQTGVWQHVAGTYDGTTMRVYVNGVLRGTQAHAMGGMPSMSMDVSIGARNMASHFDGDVDEVRLWSLERTQPQLAVGMQQPVASSETGLLAYYRFEGVGQAVMDSSDTGADGGLGADEVNADAFDPARVAPN